MTEAAVIDTVLVDIPVAVARVLVDDAIGSYVIKTRDPGTVIATAITVLDVATDVVSLALTRGAITDLIRRLDLWGHTRNDLSELVLRVGDRMELKLRVTGPENKEELVVVADRILEVLRGRTDAHI